MDPLTIVCIIIIASAGVALDTHQYITMKQNQRELTRRITQIESQIKQE
jgi:transcription elongation GreA/GreB family factor